MKDGILNNKEVMEYINNYIIPEIIGTEGRQPTVKQKKDVVNIFRQSMLEENHKERKVSGQKQLVESIFELIYNGESTDAVLRKHSANKHMYVYDEFLGAGEGNKIVKALKENGLGIDSLKGINLHIKTGQENKMGVRTYINLSQDDNGSSVIENFTIIYNNKVIYTFNRDAIDVKISNMKKGYLGRVPIPDADGYYYKKWIDKRGKIRYRNDRGQFVSYDETK